MRIFGGAQIAGLMTRFNLPEDQPIEHGMISRAIEQAQIKVEGFHFDSRKRVVEYDDVLNKHRELIYSIRKRVLSPDTDIKSYMVNRGIPEEEFEKRRIELGDELLPQIVRWVSLNVIDNYWMEHLTILDDLRQGIGLRGYAQKDPLVEYKNEAFTMFELLVQNIDREIGEKFIRVQVRKQEPVPQESPIQQAARQAVYRSSPEGSLPSGQQQPSGQSIRRPSVGASKNVGRNDPCPCGAINPNTGKPYKYKKCGLINAPYHKKNS